jgi:hypothetical protein
VLAGALLSAFIALVLVVRSRPDDTALAATESPPASALPDPDPDSGSVVSAVMREVRYQVDPDITLAIRGLRGALIPAGGDSLPIFDKPTSFSIRIRDGEIAIDTASLGRLLSRYVFAYEGSPLRQLSVSVKDGELVQRGKLKKLITLPFTIQARASVTPKGEIKLEPHKVEIAGMGVRGLLDLFRLELDDLVKSNRGHGVRIVEDIVYLDPAALLPPPRIRGHLTALRVEPGRVVQIFGRADSAVPPARTTADGPVEHYMYFQHARLRFGKLTMHDTDMLVVDQDPATPFEFSLDRYHEQLVAGYHLTTPRDGLVVYFPDVSSLGRQPVRRPR